MTRRQLLLAFGATAITWPIAAFAQQPPKVARLAYLGPTSAAGSRTRVEALRSGLRNLGYIEGRNLEIAFRWADDKYESLLRLAAELVSLNPNVIVTHGTPGVRAARAATTSIPIVMATAGDATLVGLVTNLARPEGNITGSTFFNPELASKRLEVLKDTFPDMRRIAVLQNRDNPAMKPVLEAMDQTAKTLKLQLQIVPVAAPEELEKAYTAMLAQRAEALVIIEDAMLNGNLRKIADLATKHRVPAIGLPEFAEAGALMAYGVDLVDMFYRSAYFVDKILKGAKVSDLPVERASKFELVINKKTAAAIGIRIPDSVLVRAERVIE